jgi:hypothetical protein
VTQHSIKVQIKLLSFTLAKQMETDYDKNSLTYHYYSDTLTFNFLTSGYFSFEPTQEDVGTHYATFFVYDNSGCTNNNGFSDIEFTILNVNEPPIYNKTIPKIVMNQGTTKRNIFLNDYFIDPDGDLLTYTAALSKNFPNITILSTSEIILKSSLCGDSSAIFTAKDPGNLTAESMPPIEIQVICTIPSEEEDETGDEDDSSGGGGGGGGSSGDYSCISNWKCEDWQKCLPNGTQIRICRDVAGCSNDYVRIYTQNCTYVPHCFNLIKDEDETGIDCGGKECFACQTCFDKKLNNLEEEIDCGGPNCEPCKNCYDNIQNYGETGIDCGGHCIECSSCFDGIQNGDEEGIDCGGICKECAVFTLGPIKLKNDSFLGLLIILLIIALAILTYLVKISKTNIHNVLSKIFFFLTKASRKQILLTIPQKNQLLTKINSTYNKMNEKTPEELKYDLMNIFKDLFNYLIKETYELKDIENKIKDLPTTDLVKNIISRQYILMQILENAQKPNLIDLKLNAEILRQLTLGISKTTEVDIKRKIEQYTPSKENSIQSLKESLFNASLAGQYEKIHNSKEMYIEAQKIYDNLTVDEQKQSYDYLKQLFDLTKYLSTYSKYK